MHHSRTLMDYLDVHDAGVTVRGCNILQHKVIGTCNLLQANCNSGTQMVFPPSSGKTAATVSQGSSSSSSSSSSSRFHWHPTVSPLLPAVHLGTAQQLLLIGMASTGARQTGLTQHTKHQLPSGTASPCRTCTECQHACLFCRACEVV
jgi:hypothetical protein